MDNNNRRSTQGGESANDGGGDWRSQMQHESRKRIFFHIMDKLKRQFPLSGQEGFQELRKIAMRFEEDIYTSATSQVDYFMKISSKMLAMETKYPISNAIPSNSANIGQNPQDPGSQSMQSQSGQLLLQNIANNIAAAGMQGSSQTNIPSVNRSFNTQSIPPISGVLQNSVPSAIGQGIPYNVFAYSQRQTGRQQQGVSNIHHHMLLPTQQQQHLVGQSTATNIQQNQIIGQQNRIPDMQQNQQRLPSQQNKLSNQQSQQLMGLPNNFAHMYQQQLGTQEQQQHHQLQTLQTLKQKQVFQPQRAMEEALSTSLDSTAQTGNASRDWQEETFRKIKTMKDMHFPDLNEIYQKVVAKMHQHESLLLQQPQLQQGMYPKLKAFKSMLERFISLLQISKSNLQIGYKDNLGIYEEQIMRIIRLSKPIPHIGSGGTVQQNVSNLQHNPSSAKYGISLHPSSSLGPGQINSMNSVQILATGPLQKNPVSVPQQATVNLISSQSGMTSLKANHNSMQPNLSMLQQQQDQLQQNQNLKEFQHHQMQQNLLIAPSKDSTPLQPVYSPVVVPKAGNLGHQTVGTLVPAQSLAIGTPGKSASPLLDEFTSPEDHHAIPATVVSAKSTATEEPLKRLNKVVKSMSSKDLTASVCDIRAVVSMTDKTEGSRVAVCEDLVKMAKCPLQARNLITEDETTKRKENKRCTTATPSDVSSPGSLSDSFKQLNGLYLSDLDSTATSTSKKPRIENGGGSFSSK
ncbi:hypothetical protein POM88_029561 [Heracleum sosnowskyi]|uniref:Mediator complex subunit 15 KIX domain-containing protein n=1 Tax=Heracleum sosnowskyi TaxID=360622 RepID=A0AAD8MIL4_9APIA|nr:hypothetical protein POM88_029561 [Heracleum sosnowskyi]